MDIPRPVADIDGPRSTMFEGCVFDLALADGIAPIMKQLCLQAAHVVFDRIEQEAQVYWISFERGIDQPTVCIRLWDGCALHIPFNLQAALTDEIGSVSVAGELERIAARLRQSAVDISAEAQR